MKINKILAAGIAATLAVTSLSAVASAETKTLEWKMEYTFSNVKWLKQKVAYLDDNSKIKAGEPAHETAKAFIQAETAAGAEGAKLAAALAAPYDGSAVLVTISTGAGPVKLPAGKTIATGVADALTNVQNVAKKVPVASAAADLTSGTATKTGGDAIAEAKKLAAYLKEAANAVYEIEDALKAAQSSATATEVLTDAQITALNLATQAKVYEDAADEVEKEIAKAELAMEGDPLLAENEIGGIKLSTKAFDEWSVKDGKKTGRKLKITGAHIDVVGTKRGSTASQTDSKDFQQGFKTWYLDTNGNTTHIGKDKDDFIWIGFTPKWVNRDGFINLDVYGAITDIRVTVDYALLDASGNPVQYFTQVEYDNNKKTQLENLRYFEANNLLTYMNAFVTDFDNFFKYYDPATGDYGSKDNTNAGKGTKLYQAFTGLDNSVVAGEVTENSGSKDTRKPFIKRTTANDGETVFRNKVLVLSKTDSNNSKTNEGNQDGNQTYKEEDHQGTNPKWFAGLASQCADFFNKQNNGEIIFYLEDPAAADKWVSYGVPSTEVGLRTLQGTAMALFFNYEHTTGSMQSIGVVDKDAWTITFDIASVLDDFGGLTKGTLSDIYYGLNTGFEYGNPYNLTGYVVNKVQLKYDDAPAAVDATTDDDAAVVVADDDDDVVADDDDDDIFADDDVVADDDDDDDDAGIIEDDDDDDTDVNNDVDYVDGADDDANPGTGVGLAVIPAIVAAAAAIVSKKRK